MPDVPSTPRTPDPNLAATGAALGVLDAHLAALNARDEVALKATLHFPHYRIAGNQLQVWEEDAPYFADFLARAGDGWSYTCWDFRNVIVAGPEKVHLDVQFTRFRADSTSLGSFRSLWIVGRINGRWAATARSSFAG